MEEKKHVGRPTNEEVAIRKKKKVIKYFLITIVSVLLVGGIALFLNRDNIDFSSLMGASIFKREKYVAKYYDNVINKSYYQIFMNEKKYDDYTKCKVSNSKYASCKISGNYLNVYAKKKGNVNIKVIGKNKKTGKSISKIIRIKIDKDFSAPVCKISTPVRTVRRGTNIELTVTCDEKVSYVYSSEKHSVANCFWFKYYDLSKKETKCHAFSYFEYVKDVEKIDDKSYKIYGYIPKDACISDDIRLVVGRNSFKDSSGNENVVDFISNPISIIK